MADANSVVIDLRLEWLFVELVEDEIGQHAWKLHFARPCVQPLLSYITLMVCASLVKEYRNARSSYGRAVIREYYAMPFFGEAATDYVARRRQCAQGIQNLLVAHREARANTRQDPRSRKRRRREHPEYDHAGNALRGAPFHLYGESCVGVNLQFTDLPVDLVDTGGGEYEWELRLPWPCRQPLSGHITREVCEAMERRCLSSKSPQAAAVVRTARRVANGYNDGLVKELFDAYRHVLVNTRKRQHRVLPPT